MATPEPVCNRCGRCCHYFLDGSWKKCKNLVLIGSRSSCRIWRQPGRVGTEIDRGIFCNQMSDLEHTYVGCPYNIEKPVLLVQIKRYEGRPNDEK